MDILIMCKGNRLFDSHLSTCLEHGGLFRPFLLFGVGSNITQTNRNGKWIDIRKPNMTNLECRRNIGTMEGRSECHGLIGIDVQTQFDLVLQKGSNLLLDTWNTHSTTNQFHSVNLIQCDIGRLECLGNGRRDPFKQIGTQFLHLASGHGGLEWHIGMDGFHVDGNLRIGTQYVLDLVGLDP
mmetsp:Transcript_6186/g.13918  ORF Transcript_6186/g.13918 Transcript_6186/m.13918 type:complete len:182 (-) Transcript_6186:1023-1568(-)